MPQGFISFQSSPPAAFTIRPSRLGGKTIDVAKMRISQVGVRPLLPRIDILDTYSGNPELSPPV
jgi:hypothetical protein